MAKGGSFDFGEFDKFVDKFEAFADGYEEFIKKFLFSIAVEMLGRTRERTPVGDHPNLVEFYARTDTSGNEMKKVKFETAGRRGGELQRNWQLTNVVRKGNMLEFTLFNPTSYSSFVEFGHRKVAFNQGAITDGMSAEEIESRYTGWWEGLHMAEKSIDEVMAMVPAKYKKAFNDYIDTLETRN